MSSIKLIGDRTGTILDISSYTSHSVTKRRFIGAKKKSPEMCFFFVPEGIYRLGMTKKRGNHS